jgi:hypothetical protein
MWVGEMTGNFAQSERKGKLKPYPPPPLSGDRNVFDRGVPLTVSPGMESGREGVCVCVCVCVKEGGERGPAIYLDREMERGG